MTPLVGNLKKWEIIEMDDLVFKHYFDDNYDPEYINGAFGGILPTGELVVHFYMDRLPIPNETKTIFSEDGVIEDNLTIDPEDFKIRRVIKNGIIMSIDTAKSISDWLRGMVDDMEDTCDE